MGSTQGQIQIAVLPQEDMKRWEPITDTVNGSWYLFSKLLDYSFSTNPTLSPSGAPYYKDPDTNETYYWLNNDSLSLTQKEKERLLLILKRCFGNRKYGGINLWEINKNLLKKFILKSYVLNMAATYEYFKQRFYNKNAIVKNDAESRNYPVGSTFEEFLADSRLKAKPNQLELLTMALYAYQRGGGKFYAQRVNFIAAINAHSFQKLKSAVSDMTDRNRINVIDRLYQNVISKLYHGLDD